MSIKEKDLTTIESLSEGDKLRVVTQEGNSRNIDAEAIGSVTPTVVFLYGGMTSFTGTNNTPVSTDLEFAFNDGKTFREIFGDKKVLSIILIGSAYNIVIEAQEIRSPRGGYVFFPEAIRRMNETTEFDNETSLTINGFFQKSNDYPTWSLYAICI